MPQPMVPRSASKLVPVCMIRATATLTVETATSNRGSVGLLALRHLGNVGMIVATITDLKIKEALPPGREVARTMVTVKVEDTVALPEDRRHGNNHRRPLEAKQVTDMGILEPGTVIRIQLSLQRRPWVLLQALALLQAWVISIKVMVLLLRAVPHHLRHLRVMDPRRL